MRRRHSARTRAIVDRLVLPDPWDVDQLCSSVAQTSGRPLHVKTRPPMGDTITGTIFRMRMEDVIFYRDDLTGLHREHVLCHELGHLLAGHLEGSGAYVAGADDHLAGAAAIMLHRQCQYGEVREREAEDIADLILARVRQRVHGAADMATQRAVRGFGAAMR